MKLRDEHGAEHRHRCASEAREKETRAQFADLKERLVNAEAENQRMRGYVARVQEDDLVREELIKVGDPDGEQHLVPKRRPTVFEQPRQYSPMGEQATDGAALYSYRVGSEPRRKAKHWVTY